MRLGPAMLTAFALVAPTASAQTTLPPFTGATQTYVVNGCGLGEIGPTFTVGTALCAHGTATVGTVLSPGAMFSTYLALLDITLERAPGFAYSLGFDPLSYFSYSFVRTRDGLPGGGAEDLRRYSFAEDRLLANANLGLPAADLVENSLRLTSGVVNFTYRDPRPFIGPGNVNVFITFSAVPEPATFALTAAGLLAVSAIAARQHRKT